MSCTFHSVRSRALYRAKSCTKPGMYQLHVQGELKHMYSQESLVLNNDDDDDVDDDGDDDGDDDEQLCTPMNFQWTNWPHFWTDPSGEEVTRWPRDSHLSQPNLPPSHSDYEIVCYIILQDPTRTIEQIEQSIPFTLVGCLF